MERIAAKDAFFVYADTPTTHMHMAFAGIFDPSTVPGGVDHPSEIYGRIRELYEQRIHVFPPFRWRLVEVPFGLHHPVFIEDPNFNLDFHLRRAALPAPGGKRELEAFIADLLGRKLDFNHPLWECYVVEGVEGGRWAFVAKTHHVIVDGVGGNEALVNLLDLEPEMGEVEPPEEPWEPDEVPGDLRLLGGAVAGIARQPAALTKAVRNTASMLKGVLGRQFDEDQRLSSDTLKVVGPRTFLNGPIGPHRQVGLGKVSLEDVKRVKDEVGVTVNDVVVAMCGRGLRRFLQEHGEDYEGCLVAAVPISIRPEGDEGIDNQVSGMTVPFHDDIDDPVEQLRRISKATRPAKEQLGAIAANVLTDWTQFAPPAVAAQAFRFYSRAGLARRHPPIANVTLSNVPGPDFPLYLGGSQMNSMYPLGPVIHNQALNITVVSYMGHMDIGVVADRDRVPDVGGLTGHISKALGEIMQGVGLAD